MSRNLSNVFPANPMLGSEQAISGASFTRRITAAALVAVLMVACNVSSVRAQSCGCGEPACGLEAATCGCETVGVEEPTCGLEPACGCEAPLMFPSLRARLAGCGCEVEPECGAEPLCGVEPFFAAEPSCGLDVSCGCEISTASACNKCDSGGFLTRHRVQKCNPIYQTLDLAAGGVEGVLKAGSYLLCGTPRERARQQACKTGCQTCNHCSAAATHVHAAHGNQSTFESPVVEQHMTPRPMTPTVQSIPTPAPNVTPLMDPPQTTIHKTSPGLPVVPTPAPATGTRGGSSSGRAGSLFDEMRNPFEDDSASLSSRRSSVRQTSFENGELQPVRRTPTPVRRAATKPTEVDDYADYFRQ